jgi:hypothetical protein
MAKAEAIGLPEYQAREEVLADSITAALLDNKRIALETKCRDWESRISVAMNRCHRFSLLSRAQLLYTIAAVRNHSFRELFPYIRLCFPDKRSDCEDFLVDNVRDCSHAAFSKLPSSVIDSPDSIDDEIRYPPVEEDTVSSLNTFLAIIEGVDSAAANHQIGERARSRPSVVRCINKSEEELLRTVEASLGGSVPMSSQLLWGSVMATRIDIQRFLFAVTHMTHVAFAIVGVNELNVDCREYLLKELVDLVLDAPAEVFTGQLSLIFTSKVGVDAFMIFGESLDLEVTDEMSKEHFIDLGFSDRCFPLQVVMGGPGSGKSTFIRKQMERENAAAYRTLTIHEDFTPEKFIDWYELTSATIGPGTVVGIYFNVTPYGNLNRLSRFLYNMVAFGLLEDEKTGRVSVLVTEIKHLVFVELPALPDPRSVPRSVDEAIVQPHPYISAISVLRLLTEDSSWNVVDRGSFLALLDDDHMIVAYYLDRYWKGDFQKPFAQIPKNLPKKVGNQNISVKECYDTLRRIFQEMAPTVPQTHLKCGIFVKLLAERLRFIPDMVDRMTREHSEQAFTYFRFAIH